MDYMSFSFHTEIRKGSYANSVFFMAEVQISYSQKPLVSQKCDIMKRKFKVMVNNSTNINKTVNNFTNINKTVNNSTNINKTVNNSTNINKTVNNSTNINKTVNNSTIINKTTNNPLHQKTECKKSPSKT